MIGAVGHKNDEYLPKSVGFPSVDGYLLSATAYEYQIPRASDRSTPVARIHCRLLLRPRYCERHSVDQEKTSCSSRLHQRKLLFLFYSNISHLVFRVIVTKFNHNCITHICAKYINHHYSKKVTEKNNNDFFFAQIV